MIFNKAETLMFIDKGQMRYLDIIFVRMIDEVIPLYKSSEISSTHIIELTDNSIFVIAPNENITNIFIEMKAYEYVVLNKLGTYNKHISDFHLARWYGFNKTMDYINNEVVSDSIKESRKKFLLSNFKNKVKVKNKEYFLENTETVEVY